MKTTTLSAADFINRILSGGGFHVGEHYVVTGEVSLRGAILPRPLLLHGFLFEGPVDFSDTSVPGELDFSDCRFHRNLRLNQMHVQGSIRFRRVRIDLEEHLRDNSDGVGIDAVGLESDGDMRIEELICAGSVHAAGLAVAGAANWQDIEITHSLDLSGGQIGGQLSISRCKVRGNINMMALSVRSHAEIGQVNVSGDCYLTSAHIDQGLYITSTRIEGTLLLSNARMSALQIERLSPNVQGSHFGAISAYGLEISLGFKLCGATVGPHPSDPSEAVLSLGRIKADHVQFWRPSLYWSVMIPAQEADAGTRLKMRDLMLTHVDGDIEMDAAQIVRSVDMTGLIATGRVNLSNSHIGSELQANSALTLRNSPHTRRGPREILNAALAGDTGRGEPRRASFRSLNIEDCRIETGIDLTGLDLREGLNAQHVTAGGTVMLAEAGEGVPETFINCPARADFTGAKIYKLQASGASFNAPPAVEGSALSAGLILDDAEITLLRLFPKRGLGKEETYPRPLGISNLTVRHWKLLDSENEDFRSESEEASTFLRLLKNDPRISRTTYLSIVSTLRDQGHERASSRVFRGLSWRSLQDTMRQTLDQLSPRRALFLPLQAASWLLTAAYGLLLGFGTAPLRLGALILGVGLLSYVSVYNLDSNLEMRINGEGGAASFVSAIGEDACTDWQKMLVMFRHHVPVAVNDESETCRLRGHGAAFAVAPFWPGANPPAAQWPLSPLEFGLYMRLLALMLWPPFLAFVLKRAFRE